MVASIYIYIYIFVSRVFLIILVSSKETLSAYPRVYIILTFPFSFFILPNTSLQATFLPCGGHNLLFSVRRTFFLNLLCNNWTADIYANSSLERE